MFLGEVLLCWNAMLLFIDYRVSYIVCVFVVVVVALSCVFAFFSVSRIMLGRAFCPPEDCDMYTIVELEGLRI